MSQNDQQTGPAGRRTEGVRTIVAAQLRVTDVVQLGDGRHLVTSLRMQGAPAQVSVELTGIAGRLHYPLDAPLTVLRRPGN